jgi:hypothetical protein
MAATSFTTSWRPPAGGRQRPKGSHGLPLSAALVGALASSAASAADLLPVKASPAAVVSQAWEATLASEVRYYAWRGDRGSPSTSSTASGSGSQLYVPYALQIAGNPTEDFTLVLLGRSGWVRSKQSTAGLAGEVETITDTVATATLTYLGIAGLQPFVALSMNAPTGKSVLSGAQANARMDPDLVEVGSFGEGWNIGPTVGFSVPITASFMATASVGYTWRGRFDRERSSAEINPAVQSLTRLDPGDTITGTAALAYQGNPWAWSITGAISEETTTVENGIDLYRAGRRYLASAVVSYSWPEQLGQTTLTGAYSHSNRNEVKFLNVAALVAETFNTNSDPYRVGVQHLFPIGANFAFGPTGSYLHRNSNSYDATTLQFVPAKERWAAGGQARYALSDKVTLNMRAEHVWVREDERLAPGGQQFSVLANAFVAGSAVPVVSSTGWMVAAGANAKF